MSIYTTDSTEPIQLEVLQDALKPFGIPDEVVLCVSTFCRELEHLEYSDLCAPSSAERQLTWPSLTIENDNLFITATPDLFEDSSLFACAAKWLAPASPNSADSRAEWHIIGNITSDNHIIGIRVNTLSPPDEVRIIDQYGNIIVLAVDSKKRAVFERAPETLEVANPRKVRNRSVLCASAQLAIAPLVSQLYGDIARYRRILAKWDDYCRTVLCGFVDSDAISRFRIRFRVKADASQGFGVGFVHSGADGIDFETGLGLATNHKRSVGILIRGNAFFPMTPSNMPLIGMCVPTPPELSDVSFHEPDREWLVEFDFIAKSFCLYLRLPEQWALCFEVDMPFRAITPAFTLFDKDGEIEIV